MASALEIIIELFSFNAECQRFLLCTNKGWKKSRIIPNHYKLTLNYRPSSIKCQRDTLWVPGLLWFIHSFMFYGIPEGMREIPSPFTHFVVAVNSRSRFLPTPTYTQSSFLQWLYHRAAAEFIDFTLEIVIRSSMFHIGGRKTSVFPFVHWISVSNYSDWSVPVHSYPREYRIRD